MKRTILLVTLLAILFPLPSRAQQQVTCNLSATAAVPAAATATLLGAVGTGTGRYFLCGYALSPGAGTGQLSFGASCAALGTPLSPQIAANAVAIDSSSMWRGIPPVPAGQLICITGGTGASGSVFIYYSIN